jgi:adenylate cyclase
VLGRKDDPNCVKTLKELRTLVGIKYEAPEKKKRRSADSNDEEKEVKYEILE